MRTSANRQTTNGPHRGCVGSGGTNRRVGRHDTLGLRWKELCTVRTVRPCGECDLGELRYTHIISFCCQGERGKLPACTGHRRGGGIGARKLSCNMREGGRASVFASDRTVL